MDQRGDLTFREFEVAAKAAAKWLDFVWSKAEERELLELEKREEEQRQKEQQETEQLAKERQAAHNAEAAKLQTAVLEDQSIKPRATAVSESAPKTFFGTLPQKKTDTSKLKPEALTWEVGWKGDLTYHQIAVASKAAFKWLEYVDRRVTEREEIERSRIEHENSSKIKSKSDTKSEAMDSQKIDQQTPLKHPIYSPDSGKYSNKVKFDTSKSKKKQHKSHSSTSAEYYSSVVHTEEIYEETSYWVETTYSGTGELQLNQPDRKEHFKQREESSTWKRKQFMTVRGEDDDFETEDNEQLISGGQMDVHEVRLGSNAAAKWLDRVISRSIDETGEDGRTEMETTTSETTETSFRRSELFSREISEESRSVNRYCGQLQIPPSDNKDNAAWQSDTTGDENFSVEAEKGAETDIQKEKRAKPQRALVSIPSSESVVLHNPMRYFADTHSDNLGDSQCIAQAETDMYLKNQELNSIPEVSEDSFLIVRRPRYEIDLQIQASVKDSVEGRDQNMVDERDLSSLLKIPVEGDTDVHNTMKEIQLGSTAATKWVTSLLSRDDNVPDGSIAERTDRIESSRPKLGVKGAKLSDSNEENLVSTTTTTNRQSEPVVTEESCILQRLTRYETELQQRETTVTPNENLSQEKTIGRSGNVETNDPARGTADHYTIREIKLGTTAATKWINKLLSKEDYLQTEARDPPLNQIISSEPNDGNNRSSFDRKTYKFQRYFNDTASEVPNEGKDNESNEDVLVSVAPTHNLQSEPEVSEESFLTQRRPRYEIELQQKETAATPIELMCPEKTIGRSGDVVTNNPVTGTADHYTIREIKLGTTATTKSITNLLSKEGSLEPEAGDPQTNQFNLSEPFDGNKKDNFDRTSYKFHDPQRYFTDNASEVINEGTDNETNGEVLVSAAPTCILQSEPEVSEESFLIQRRPRYELELQQKETAAAPSELISQEKTIGRSGDVETNDPATGTVDHYTIREIKLGTTATTKSITNLLSKEESLEPEARGLQIVQSILSEPNDGIKKANFDKTTYSFHDPLRYFTDNASKVPNEGTDNKTNQDVLVSAAPTLILQSGPEMSEGSFLIQRRPRYEIEPQQKENVATTIELMSQENTIGRSGDVETNDPATSRADHYTIREVNLSTTAATKWITNLFSKEGSLEPEADDPQTNQSILSEPIDGIKKANLDKTTYSFHDPQRYFTDNTSEVINERTDNETNGEVLVSAAPTRILKSEPEVSEESFLIQRRPRYEIELQQKETAATPSELMSQEKTIGRSGDVETNDTATGIAGHYTIREIKLSTTAATKWITNLLSKEESLEPEARDLQTNQSILFEPTDGIKNDNFDRTTYNFHDPLRYFTNNASKVPNEGTDNEINEDILVSVGPTRTLQNEPEVSEESFIIQHRPRYEIELQEKETAATPIELMSQEKTIGRSGDVETNDSATGTADQYTIREIKFGTTAATKRITNLFSKEESLEPDARDRQTNQSFLSEPKDGIKKDNVDVTNYNFPNPQRYFTDNASDVPNEGTDNETIDDSLVSVAPNLNLQSEPEVSEESFLIQRRPRYEIELQQKETAENTYKNLSQKETSGRSGDVETNDPATGTADHYTIREVKLGTTAATKWITNLLSKEDSLEPEKLDPQTNQSIFSEANDGINRNNFDRTNYSVHDPQRYFTDNASDVPNERSNESNDDILVSDASASNLQSEPKVSEESLPIQRRPRYKIELQHNATAETPNENLSQEETVSCAGNVETKVPATGRADHYTIREMKLSTTAATKWTTKLLLKEEAVDLKPHSSNEYGFSESNDRSEHQNLTPDNSFLRSHSSKLEDLSQIGPKATHWNPATSADDKLGYSENFERSIQANAPDQSAGLQSVPDDQESFFDNKALKSKTAVDNSNVRSVDGTEERKPNVKFSEKGTSSKPDEIAETLQPMPVAAEITATANLDSQVDSSYNLSTSFDDDASSMTGSFMSGSSYASSLADGSPAFLDPDFELKMTGALQSIADKFKRKKARRRPKGESKRDLQGISVSNSKVVQRDSTTGSQREPTIPMISSDRKLESIPDEEFSLEIPKTDGDIEETGQNVDKYMTSPHQQPQKNLGSTTRDLSQQILDPFKSSQKNKVSVVTTKQQPQNNPSSGDKEKVLDENSEQRKIPGSVERPRKDTVNKKESSLIAAEDIPSSKVGVISSDPHEPKDTNSVNTSKWSIRELELGANTAAKWVDSLLSKGSEKESAEISVAEMSSTGHVTATRIDVLIPGDERYQNQATGISKKKSEKENDQPIDTKFPNETDEQTMQFQFSNLTTPVSVVLKSDKDKPDDSNTFPFKRTNPQSTLKDDSQREPADIDRALPKDYLNLTRSNNPVEVSPTSDRGSNSRPQDENNLAMEQVEPNKLPKDTETERFTAKLTPTLHSEPGTLFLSKDSLEKDTRDTYYLDTKDNIIQKLDSTSPKTKSEDISENTKKAASVGTNQLDDTTSNLDHWSIREIEVGANTAVSWLGKLMRKDSSDQSSSAQPTEERMAIALLGEPDKTTGHPDDYSETDQKPYEVLPTGFGRTYERPDVDRHGESIHLPHIEENQVSDPVKHSISDVAKVDHPALLPVLGPDPAPEVKYSVGMISIPDKSNEIDLGANKEKEDANRLTVIETDVPASESSSVLHSEPSNVFQLDCSKDKDKHEAASPGAIQDNEPSNVLEKQPSETDSDQIAGSQQPFADVFEHKGDNKQIADEAEDETRKEQDENSKISAANDGIPHRPPHSEPISITVVPPNDRSCEPYLESLTSPTFDDDASSVTGSFISGSSYASSLADGTAPTFDPDFELKMTGALQKIADKYKRKKTRRRPKGESKRDKLNKEPENSEPKPPIEKIPEESTPHSEHTNSELGIIAPDVSTESKLESKPNTEFDLELPACEIPGDSKEPSHKAESDDKIGVDANKKPNQSMAQIDARIRNIPGADKFEGNKRDPKDDHKSLIGVRDVKLGSMAAGKWLDKLLSKDSKEPPENKAVDQKTPITASDNTKTANRSLYEPTEVIDNLSTDFNQKANIEHSTHTSSVSEDKLIRPPEESEGLRNEELVRKPGDNEDERYSRSANHDVSAVHEAAGQPPRDNESGSQEIVIEKFLNYTPKMNQGKSIEEIEPTTILNPEVPDSDQTQQQSLVAELNSEVISLNPIAQTRLESTPDMGLDIDGSIKNQGDEPEIGITRTDSEGKLDLAAASGISNTSEPEKLNQPNESTMSVREVRYASIDASKWIDNLQSKDASPNLSSCAENRDNHQSDLNEASSESPPPCVVLDENQRKSEDDCVTEPHGEDCIGKFPISTPRETLQISENITTALHGEKSEEPNKNATKLTFIHKEGQLSGDRLLNVQFDDREVSENEKKSSGGAERPFSVREFKLGSTAAGKWIDNLLYKDIDEANVIDLRPDQKRFEKNKTDQLTAEYKSDSVPNETPSRLEMAGESSCDYTTQTPDLVTYEVPGIKVPHLNEEKSAEGSKLTSYLRPDVATADRSQHRTFVAESNQENISLDPAAQTKLESTPDMGPNIDISIGNQEVGDESETGKPDTYQTEDDKFESLDTTKGQLSVRELKLGSTAAGKWVDKLLSKDFEEPNKIELTPDEEDLEQSKTDQLTDYEAQSDRGDSVTRPVSTVEPPRDKGTAISDAITPAVHGDKKPHLSQEESGNESKPTIPLQPEAAISDQIQQRSFVSESNTESFWLDPAAPTELERSGIPDTYENEDDKIESLDATKAQFSVRELKLGSTAAGKWVDKFLSKDCEQPNKIEWTPEQECLEQSKTDQLTDYESQSVRGDSVNRPVSTVEPPRDQSTAILDAATPAVHVDEKPHLSQEESGNKSKRTVILQSEAAISDQTQQRPFVSESNQESISLDPAVQTKLESTPDLVLDIEIGNQKSGDDSETGKTDTYETEDDKMESLDATKGQLSVRELKLGSNAAGKWVDKLLSKDCEEPYKIELTPDEEGLKLSETDQMTDNESQSVRGDSVNRPVSTVEPTRDQSMVISDYATPAFHVDKKPHLSKEESGNELKSTATLQPEAATSHQTQQRPFVSEPNQESILLDPAAQNKLESTPDTVLDIDTSIGNQESGDEPETRKPDTYETEDDKMKTLEATKGQLSVRELKLGTTAAGKWVDKLLSKDCEEPNKIELTPDEEDLEQSKTDQLTEYESQSVRGVSVYRPVSTVEPPRDQSMAILDAANPAVDIDKKPNLSQEESGNESKPRVTLQPEAATSHQTQQRPFVSEPNQESILLHPAAQNKLESTPDMVLAIDTSIGNQESGDEPETRKPDSYETDDDKMKSLEATKGQLSIRELKLGSNAAGKWVDKLLSKDCEEPNKIELTPDEEDLEQSKTDQLTDYEAQSDRGDSVTRPVSTVEPPRDKGTAISDAITPAVHGDKKPHLSQEESGNESKPTIPLQPEAAISDQIQQRSFVSESNTESFWLDPAAPTELERSGIPDTYENEDDKIESLDATKAQFSVRELKLGSTAAGKWVDKFLSKDCEQPNKIEWTPEQECLEQSKTDQLTDYESQSVRGDSVNRPVSTVEPPRDQSTAILDAATPAVHVDEKPHLSQEESGNKSKRTVILQSEAAISDQTQQRPFVSESNQESISLDPAVQTKLESTPDLVLDIEIGNQKSGDDSETGKTDTYETEDDKMESLDATKGQLSVRELKLGSNAAGKWVDKLLSKDCEEPYKIELTPDEEGLKLSETDQMTDNESQSVRGDSVNRPVSTVEPTRDQSMVISDYATPAFHVDKKPHLSKEESGNELKSTATLQPEAATSHQTQQRPFVSEPNQESILLDPAAQNKLESTPDTVLDIDTSIGNQESGDEPETRKPDTYETEDDKMKTLEATKGQLSVRELKLGTTAAGKWVDKLLSKDCEEPNKIELTPDEEDLEQSKTDQLTEYESQSVRGVSVYRPVSTVEPPRDQSMAILDAANPAVDIDKKPNLSQEESGNESKPRVTLQPEAATSHQTQQRPFVSEPNQESILLHPAAQNKLESTPDMVLAIDTSIGNQESGDEPETRKPDSYETDDDKMKSLEATKGQLSIRELKLGSNAAGKWVDKLLSKDCEEPYKIESRPDEDGLKQSETDQLTEYESQSVRGDSVKRPVLIVEPPRDQSMAILDAANPAVDIDKKPNLSQEESGNESKPRVTLQPEAATSHQTQQRPFVSEPNQESILLDPAAQNKLESTPDMVLDIDTSIGNQESGDEPETRKPDTYETEDDKMKTLEAKKGQLSVRELKLGSTAAGKWVDKLLSKDCEEPNKIELTPDEEDLEQSKTDQLTEYESQSVRGVSVYRPVSTVEPPRDQSTAISDAATPAVDINKKPNLSQEERGNESKQRVIWQPESLTSNQTQQQPFVSEPNQESISLDPAAQNKLESTPDMVLDIDTSIGNQENGDEPETRKPDTYETEDDKMKSLEATKGQLSIRELKLGSNAVGKWVDKLLSKDCEEPNKIESTPDEEGLKQSDTDQVKEYESESVRGDSVNRPVSTVEPPRDQSTAISDAATPAVDIDRKRNLSQAESGNESKQRLTLQPEAAISDQTQQRPFFSESNQETISLDPAAQTKLESTPDLVLDIDISIGSQEIENEPGTRKTDTYESEDDKIEFLDATKGQFSVRELKLGSTAAGKWVDKLLFKDCEQPNKIELAPDEEDLELRKTDPLKDYESQRTPDETINQSESTVESPRDMTTPPPDVVTHAVLDDEILKLKQGETEDESMPVSNLLPQSSTHYSSSTRETATTTKGDTVIIVPDPGAQFNLESIPDTFSLISGGDQPGSRPKSPAGNKNQKPTKNDIPQLISKPTIVDERGKGVLNLRDAKFASKGAAKWIDKLLSKEDDKSPNLPISDGNQKETQSQKPLECEVPKETRSKDKYNVPSSKSNVSIDNIQKPDKENDTSKLPIDKTVTVVPGSEDSEGKQLSMPDNKNEKPLSLIDDTNKSGIQFSFGLPSFGLNQKDYQMHVHDGNVVSVRTPNAGEIQLPSDISNAKVDDTRLDKLPIDKTVAVTPGSEDSQGKQAGKQAGKPSGENHGTKSGMYFGFNPPSLSLSQKEKQSSNVPEEALDKEKAQIPTETSNLLSDELKKSEQNNDERPEPNEELNVNLSKISDKNVAARIHSVSPDHQIIDRERVKKNDVGKSLDDESKLDSDSLAVDSRGFPFGKASAEIEIKIETGVITEAEPEVDAPKLSEKQDKKTFGSLFPLFGRSKPKDAEVDKEMASKPSSVQPRDSKQDEDLQVLVDDNKSVNSNESDVRIDMPEWDTSRDPLLPNKEGGDRRHLFSEEERKQMGTLPDTKKKKHIKINIDEGSESEVSISDSLANQRRDLFDETTSKPKTKAYAVLKSTENDEETTVEKQKLLQSPVEDEFIDRNRKPVSEDISVAQNSSSTRDLQSLPGSNLESMDDLSELPLASNFEKGPRREVPENRRPGTALGTNVLSQIPGTAIGMNESIDTTLFNFTLNSTFCPRAESTLEPRPHESACSDYDVEVFCYTTTGSTSMVDLMSLEVLCYLLAVDVKPIVHSIHSYETLCQESYPKYVIRNKKEDNVETVFYTSQEVMMFLNAVIQANTPDADTHHLAKAEGGRGLKERGLQSVEKLRLGLVYTLFFHRDNFAHLVTPFYMKVLPYLTAISKPKMAQDFWESFIGANGRNVDTDGPIIIEEAVHAMQDLIDLTESDVRFPHKDEIEYLFMASIIQLNLVDLKPSRDPFHDVISENQQLNLEAAAIFRRLQLYLPRVNWQDRYYYVRPSNALSMSLQSLIPREFLTVGGAVSVYACPAPDGLPSWDLSCLKTIVILRGLGFPVNLRSCQEGSSPRMFNDCPVYEMDETTFDSPSELMKYLSNSFKFTLPKAHHYNEQKLVQRILDRFREVSQQTMWTREENKEFTMDMWREQSSSCTVMKHLTSTAAATSNQSPPESLMSPVNEQKMRLELDSAIGYLSGILDDKLFLLGSTQPSELDAELFSVLAVPLMNEFPWNPLYQAMSTHPNMYYFLADILRNYLNIEPKRTYQDLRLSKMSSLVSSPKRAEDQLPDVDDSMDPDTTNVNFVSPLTSSAEYSPSPTKSIMVSIHVVGCPSFLPSLDPHCLFAAIYLGMNDIPTKFVTKHCYSNLCCRKYPAFTVRRFHQNKLRVFFSAEKLIAYLEKVNCLPHPDDSHKTLNDAFIRSAECFLEPAVVLHFWRVFGTRFEQVFNAQSSQCCLGSLRFSRIRGRVVPKVIEEVQTRYSTQTDSDTIQMVFASAEAFLRDIGTLLGGQSFLCGRSYSKLDAKIASLLLMPLLCNVGSSTITRVLQSNQNLQDYLYRIYRGYLRQHILYLINDHKEIILSPNLNVLEVPHFDPYFKMQQLNNSSRQSDSSDVRLLLSHSFSMADQVVIYTPLANRSGLPTLDHECIQLAAMLRSQNISVHFEHRHTKLYMQPELPIIEIRQNDGTRFAVPREEIDLYLNHFDDAFHFTSDEKEQHDHLLSRCDLHLLPAVLYTLWAVSENFESLTLDWFTRKCFESNKLQKANVKRDEVIRWIQEEIHCSDDLLSPQSSIELMQSAIMYLKELSAILGNSNYVLCEHFTSLDAQLFALLFILTEIEVPSNPLSVFIERDSNLHRYDYQIKTRIFTTTNRDPYTTSMSSFKSKAVSETVTSNISTDDLLQLDSQPLILRAAVRTRNITRRPVVIQCFGYKSRVPTLDVSSLELAASLAFVHVPVKFNTTTRGFSLWLMYRPPPVRSFSLDTATGESIEGTDHHSFLSDVAKVYGVHPDSWLANTQLQDMHKLREYILDALVPFVSDQLWFEHYHDVARPWIKNNLPLFVSDSIANQQRMQQMHERRSQTSSETLLQNYISCCQKLSWLLNENEFLLGCRPCTLDALVFSHLSVLRELKSSLCLDLAEPTRDNLIKYLDRLSARYVLLNPGWRRYNCGMYWSLALMAILSGTVAFSAMATMEHYQVWPLFAQSEPHLFTDLE